MLVFQAAEQFLLLNLLELDFRDLFPSLFAKGKEELNRLEGLLATKEREQNDVELKLANIAGHLERMPDSGTLLGRLATLERQKAEKEKVESTKMKNEWGSQIRSYVLDDRRVKDHRTQHETRNPDLVLDGEIGPFLKAWLMHGGVEQN